MRFADQRQAGRGACSQLSKEREGAVSRLMKQENTHCPSNVLTPSCVHCLIHLCRAAPAHAGQVPQIGNSPAESVELSMDSCRVVHDRAQVTRMFACE